jgi:hypothetical protein
MCVNIHNENQCSENSKLKTQNSKQGHPEISFSCMLQIGKVFYLLRTTTQGMPIRDAA